MQRYSTMSIVENIISVTASAIMITICIIIAVKTIKGIINGSQNTVSSIWFDADYDVVSTFSIVTCAIIAILLLISVILLCYATGELIRWIYVPEVKFLEMLKGLIN
jgi:hypothetical protein